MNSILFTFKNTGVLHHAHAIVGVPEKNREALNTLLDEIFGGETEGHPDLWELNIEQIGIDESRALREEQSRQPFKASRRVFIIQTFGLTEPAQHALLKTLEDPNPTSHFFLLIPSLDGILETLRSRFMVVRGVEAGNEHQELAEAFLKKYPAERLTLLEKQGLINADADKKKETRRALEAFFLSLETLLAQKLRGAHKNDAHTALQELYFVKQYLGDPAAALRLLVEHLALVIPVLSE